MKYLFAAIGSMLIALSPMQAQDKAIRPTLVITGTYLGETPPLRDLPVITAEEWRQMEQEAGVKLLNPDLEERSYPFASTALPKGPDPVWQKRMGRSYGVSRAPIVNFQAQTSPYYPPDANGVVGPNHYMQTINTTYAIYNKSGTLLAGPTNLNTLFSGVTGSSCNDGDPIMLYDEQAGRYLVAEFSICGANDYMLVAVSTTSDPTGTWHKYSFDVADLPDYMKFGIWEDGYYMGTNNDAGNDIYVFQRSQMLTGGTALAVGFDNPWRPTTVDGFMCVPPLDNDGAFAPAGSPGMFITINDDAIAGGSDEIWLYELAVNWASPASSTFTRSQQIAVAPFDSNFGSNWDNIAQLGTAQELDAIPQVIMNVPQYRNFGSYQTIVCCHTVDIDASDHAGIRWYELRKTASSWTIRQQGTYAPDSHSRWMGSIMLNGDNEIGLAYSVSSSSMYPGIRYCGQSAYEYGFASGVMDIAEENIQNGLGSQTGANRWGDYSNLSVDPVNDSVFWFTTQYISSGGSRYTRVAAFNIPIPAGRWIGGSSTSWNSPANWLDGQVPGSSTDITVISDAANWPTFTGNLTLGTNCGNITLQGNAQMTVTGNLTINNGKKLDIESAGTIKIGGNWNNQGIFNYGTGTVEFYGNAPASIEGSLNNGTLADYSRSTFTLGMTPMTDGTLSSATGDDGSADVAVPFTFYLAGVASTNAHITTNGWLSLNGSGGTVYDNNTLFSSAAPNLTLAPWFDDLDDDNTSNVKYKTEGAAPNRTFTIEWYRIRSYATNPNVRLSFQAKFFETSNIVEFHYGSVEGTNHNAGESASIGLEDATGGAQHFIEATTGSMTTPVTSLTSETNWPTVNYRFTPIPVLNFYNLLVNKENASLTVNFDVNIHGDMTVNAGSILDVPASKKINLLVP